MLVTMRPLGKIGIASFILLILGLTVFIGRSQYGLKLNQLEENLSGNCSFENYVFGRSIQQNDPCLIAAFKSTMLIPPPPFDEQRKHNQTKLNISKEIPSNIDKFNWVEKLLVETESELNLPGKGFFIECGANDGEFISPTLRLETTYNWTGLLIEANPGPFATLLTKKRNAWTVNAAVCTSEHPQPVVLYTYPKHKDNGVSGLTKNKKWGKTKAITVPCVPLYTILTAIEVKTVDYLSLDVEGVELAILQTIPYDKVKFKVMTVEYNHIPGGSQPLTEFLSLKGYKYIKEISDKHTKDNLYVHESLYELALKLNQSIGSVG